MHHLFPMNHYPFSKCQKKTLISKKMFISNPNFQFLYLLIFSVHILLAQPYTLPDKYFINCGSATNFLAAGRRFFIGDLNATHNLNFQFTGQNSGEITRQNDSLRIFTKPAFYEFHIEQDAVHIVRLHFSPSDFLPDLSTAHFNVSANGLLLLKDLTAGNGSASTPEFFLRLKTGKFRILFLPRNSSSIAFINAIEVFPTPPNVINETISDFRTFRTIYRVNVGGEREIPASEDNLWREWAMDDGFLLNPSSAKDSSVYPEKPNYLTEDDEYIAPDYVYKTAKQMNINPGDPDKNSNLTWSFRCRKRVNHLLRVHFYDIIGLSSNSFLVFNLFVGNDLVHEINSPMDANEKNCPFHVDFLVDSDVNEFINVSVGPLGTKKTVQIDAFLNGVEIMEVVNEVSVDPHIDEPEGKEKKKNSVGLLVGLLVGGFGLVCILGFGIWFCLKWGKPKSDEGFSLTNTQWSPLPVFGGGSTHSRLTDRSHRTTGSSPLPNLNLGLKFSLLDIKDATNNFNKKFLVGEGGFGKVYKGVLRNGTRVAVKRSQPGAGQGLTEFESEITILSKIRHRHLVLFIGYCDDGMEMILIYEFLEKGTLREHLYNSKFPPLPWKSRLEICIGAARGLHYLHKGSAGGIIHRDVKSTNILLDENFVAKVSDFGLSRAGPLDETHVSTDIKGTFGYLDPEYFRTQQLTEKSDVYSFGVLLLEVLCARPALNPTLPREQINLAEWGLSCKKLDLLEEIIDPKLEGQIDPNSLRKFSDTVEKCLQEDATDRPTMADVLWDLEYALQLQQSTQSRMPHEDSETNANGASSNVIQRFPSIGSSIMRDYPDESRNLDISHLTASEVFSQMKADGNGR